MKPDALKVAKAAAATPAEVSGILKRAYPEARGWAGFVIRWRPYICPFHELLKPIPPAWSFIDVGCGVGLMSVLLAHARRATRVVGIDTSARALDTARRALMPAATETTFRHISARDPWPDEQVDGVVCLDVLHHVPAAEQRDFVRRIAQLNWTGKIFFKDVSPRPAWKATASRVHDLLVSRETISIRAEDVVKRWFEEEGLAVTEPLRLDMLWYSHYFFMVERA